MGKYIVIICLLASGFVLAQQPAPPAQPSLENLTLDQRFQLMKSRGESYNDYKVIKEVVLDGVWKITTDSIKKVKAELGQAKTKISQLESEMQQAKANVEAKELSAEEIIFDSTHVTVLGVAFSKGVFITMTMLILGGLIFLLVALFGTFRVTRANLKEREVAVDVLTKEFEEYRKKTLDKEAKILRQLQDERNKYQASIR